MFILNHVVLDVENSEVSVANFVFETREEAEKAREELNKKYDLVKVPNVEVKVFSDVRPAVTSTGTYNVKGYLHELNRLRLELDDNYTDEEFEETENKIKE